jgi:hypothetical protein
MRPPWTLLVAALAATALSLPAQAQSSTFSVVAQGDAADGRTLSTLAAGAGIGYFDADNDGAADPSSPTEPVYLDLDGSHSVSYGDVRLAAHGHYPAASTVDVTNADLSLPLTAPRGWLASTAQAAWYLDLDGNLQVSAGDLRLSDRFGGHVGAGDGDVRTPLQAAQTATPSFGRIGYVDGNSNGRADAGEGLYFDLDASGAPGSGKVNAGDLRVAPGGPGLDDGPTRAEFDQATGKASATGGPGSTGGLTVVHDHETTRTSAWGTPETVLLVLALANLAGLAVLWRRDSRPRNPFK